MDKDILIESLEAIKVIVDKALTGAKRQRPRRVMKVKTVSESDLSSVKLPKQILRLRDEEFLKQKKTANEVHAKLQSTYSRELNRVEVALLRLANKRKLRKASKVVGKVNHVAYV